MLRRHSNRGVAGGEPIAVLDIGTHKVCCLIVSADGCPHGEGEAPSAGSKAPLRLLGLGHQRSRGIAAGGVVDLRLAQAAVAAAVSQAEQAAGLRIDRVTTALSTAGQQSRTFKGHVELASGQVEDADIRRLNAGAHDFAARGSDAVVMLNRLSYRLDDLAGIIEPRGLAGRRLEAMHHAVTAPAGHLKNLQNLIASCQLDTSAIVPAGFAAGIAATTEEERRLGAIAIDIGAGTTSIAAFADGHYVAGATMPFGGQHITEDLSQNLGLPLAEAERIKALYASVAIAASDEHDLVLLVRGPGDEAGSTSATRGHVCRIVQRRVTWIVAGIRACLENFRSERLAQATVILSGGTAELAGLDTLVSTLLDRPARISQPPRFAGVGGRFPGGIASPSFSCVVGLALMASQPSPWLVPREQSGPVRSGYMGRVEQWLKESF